jgi:hypothetical protein
MRRKYLVVSNAERQGSVRVPFPGPSTVDDGWTVWTGGRIVIRPSRTTWKYVEYYSSRHTRVAEFDKYEGIYTGGMGDCIAVAILYGEVSKYTGSYAFATLGHSAGGDRRDLDWKKMMQSMSPLEVLDAQSSGDYNVQAVISASAASRSTIENFVDLLISYGVRERNILWYARGGANGFGVDKHGFFGDL